MHRLSIMDRVIATLLFWTLAFSASAASLTDYLPVGESFSGRVMQMAPSPEYIEIAKKVQAAAVADQEWFQAYAKKHDYAKGNLPYHEKLGVTEAEWQRLGELNGQMSMQQIGTVSIHVKKLDGSGYVITTVPESFPLHGASVSMDQASAQTKYGVLETKSEINQTDSQSITGRWQGLQWKHEELRSDTEGLSVKLAVGKRSDFNDGIIYYDVKNYLDGSRERFHYVVLYQTGR